MTRIPAAALSLVLGFTVAFAPSLRADDFERINGGGEFFNGNWVNRTKTPPGGPNVMGNPGPGDLASFIFSLSASGGSVMTLAGAGPSAVTLSLSGSFDAQTAGGFTLNGPGTLNVQQLYSVRIPSGIAKAQTGTAVVNGGSLLIQNYTPSPIDISNGGSVKAIAIANEARGVVSTGGSLTVNGTANDMNLTLQSGGTFLATNVSNGLDWTVTINDAGSTFTVAQDFAVRGGFVDMSKGGALAVSGKFILDGGNDHGGQPIGGGGGWQGPNTTITSSGSMFVGDAAPRPGFSLGIGTGTVVRTGNALIASRPGSYGVVSMSDPNTLWEVLSGGMAIGQDGTADFTMTSGARLLLDSGTNSAVGLSAGSHGRLALDNATVDAKGAMAIGEFAGSTGIMLLDSGSALLVAGEFIVGDSGSGGLSINHSTATVSGDQTMFRLGNQSGGSGNMSLNATTFVASQGVIVGNLGRGSVSATSNSSVKIAGFTAPFAKGGQATIIVDGSDWVNTYFAYLGQRAASDRPSTLLVNNNGTMRVGQQMTIFRSGTATISTGGRMAVGSGDFGPAGSLRVSEGGILLGYGRVQGQVIVASGGLIFPGNSPGILTVDGSYQQEAGSTYFAEIGGTDAGDGYDQISVTGAATLGGSLSVRLVNGFTPAVGQTFRIVNASSVSGAFASVSAPSQAGISLTSDATGVTATITSIVAGAPVISSETTITAAPGAAFSYQITATNNPSSFGAMNLPQGLTVDASTGLITGKPANAGTFIVPINADNASGSGQADLVIEVDPIFNARTLIGPSAVVEFYNAGFDHYFISINPQEISDLDTGVHPGWARTNLSFKAYASATFGTNPVCRFYIPPQHGDSHFFSAGPAECASVLQKTMTDPNYSGYDYEAPDAFYIGLPDLVTGACPAGTTPVFRLWNQRADSNHRYTTDSTVRTQMLAKGYASEGYGPLGTAMCAPN